MTIRLSSLDERSVCFVDIVYALSSCSLAPASTPSHIVMASSGFMSTALASASFKSSTASSKAETPPTHELISTSGALFSASRRNARAAVYSARVRWTMPSRSERMASSSTVSRSSFSVFGAGVARYLLSISVIAGVSEDHSWICAMATELSIREWVFQTT